jgi:opacity protein-like surface antigen
MKTTLIAVSAAALIAAAPAVFAQAVSSKSPSVQHNVPKKRHPGVSGYALRHATQAKGPGTSGYALPGAPMDSNPNAGGGGGGSGM